MKKRLPIGISDFKKIIEEDYVYVDKSLLIKELIEKGSNVALIPRMRRFGKTLNLSMLRYFFEKSKEDNSHLFTSLKIREHEIFRSLQGQFPVIFLSLKDVKFNTWDDTLEAFRGLIAEEFERHRYLLETLTEDEAQIYSAILHRKGGQNIYTRSLGYLSKLLHRFHKKKVVILLDEYDTPVHSTYEGKFNNELTIFMQNWLSGGLKDNHSLKIGVLTGILRIFPELNNVYTILSDDFQDKFGLVESEVQQLLEDYGLKDKLNDVRNWYNGYRIGSQEGMYNPWSVLNYIYQEGTLAPYWVNTSENALMKQLLTQGTDDMKSDLEILIKGGMISKTIDEGIVFSNLEHNPDTIWSLLLFSGYLTLAESPSYGIPCKLRIPNVEVNELYQQTIFDWFGKTIHQNKYKLLLTSLINGDIDTFSQIFQEFLASSVSVFDVGADEPEKIYHAFILGMLLGLKDTYEVKSNRESGYGRYDVMLIPKNLQDLGIIMEFKKVGRFENTDLETAVNAALKQIEDKKYAQELLERGIHRILYLALAFEGKRVAFRSKFANSKI